jgi:AcrR family transcriptional regulator
MTVGDQPLKRGPNFERSAFTRTAVITEATRAFAAVGYQAVSVDAIAKHCGLTKGGLYHHFPDKKALFCEVVEQEHRNLRNRVREKTKRGTPWEVLWSSCMAFLDACLDSHVQRILLLDGPSVLGWEAWKAIDDRYWLEDLCRSLRAVLDETNSEVNADLLGAIITSALTEAAIRLAIRPDQRKARKEAELVLSTLLRGVIP